jgi:hypothetical protein
MARFQASWAYHSPDRPIRLLPFRFERTGPGEYLVSNIVGDFVRLTIEEFDQLVDEPHHSWR